MMSVFAKNGIPSNPMISNAGAITNSVKKEQMRTINQQITKSLEQIEMLTDSSANLQSEMDRLAQELFQHFQILLTAYQDSIQSIEPFTEKKLSNCVHIMELLGSRPR